MKFIKNILLITIPTLFIVFVILEIFARIIGACEFPMHKYDMEEQIYKFDTTYAREGTWSRGRWAQVQGNWRINNLGWIDAIDYDKNRPKDKPLIAMFGDSQLEALLAGVDGNLAHFMREDIGEDFDIYQFGKSGAPLTEYLHQNRYCNKYWDPNIIVFLLSYNDFVPSFVSGKRGRVPMWLQFDYDEENGTFKEIQSVKKERSFLLSVIIKANYYSAFFRYLFYNLRVTQTLVATDFFKSLQAGDKKEIEKYAGNVSIKSIELSKEPITQLIDVWIKKIKKENPNRRIIVSIDAVRNLLYKGKSDSLRFKWLPKTLSELATKNEIEFVDLHIPFHKDYQINQKKFNSDVDGHWIPYGFEVASKEIVKRIKQGKPENDSLLALSNRSWWDINQ